VTVRVWDSFGNTGTASAWVIIPLPPPQATVTPTTAAALVVPQPTSTLTRQPTATATPTMEKPPVAVVKTAPVIKPAKKIQLSNIQIILWPAFTFVGLLAVLASASLSDRRPWELKALAKSLDKTREIQNLIRLKINTIFHRR